MLTNAKWIRAEFDPRQTAPIFRKAFSVGKAVRTAVLSITARGVYEASLNGRRVGEFILAPGWTSYKTRLQVQEYDVTEMLDEQNSLSVTLAGGWFNGRICRGWVNDCMTDENAVIASLKIVYADGSTEEIVTDSSWQTAKSGLTGCDIYDGQSYDASVIPGDFAPAVEVDCPKDNLIPQEGEEVRFQETLRVRDVITTPKGETVLDFGQNLTGVPEISLAAKAGDRVKLSFAEILDHDGNFYTENYRSAKAEFVYVCRDGAQVYRPTLTFYGFRYVRVDEFPGEVTADSVTARVLHSEMKRTGRITTGDPLLNRLMDNVIWGQKGNYLDVPTDCPQRDERLGWLGDAQVFVKTAAYNYDVEKFFKKWLGDMRADQCPNGGLPNVVPNTLRGTKDSAAWSDAACVCPWQIYEHYGDESILRDNFEMMRRYVDHIAEDSAVPYRWKKKKGDHYADWLGLDAPYGQYKGSSDEDLIASAYYAYSTSLLIRAGKVLGYDMAQYEELWKKIADEFYETYHDTFRTQTEHAVALFFGLAKDKQAVADSLAALVRRDGERLMTGFVGTPYILHALSESGHTDLAYTLLLRREFPSWIYPVTMGATTMWEHWDGIVPDGRLWSKDMNSYNHYAYGAVADWIYEKAAGIRPLEAGFKKIRFAPEPDPRLGRLEVRFSSRAGEIASQWFYDGGMIRYRIETPVDAEAVIGGKTYHLTPGVWEF